MRARLLEIHEEIVMALRATVPVGPIDVVARLNRAISELRAVADAADAPSRISPQIGYTTRVQLVQLDQYGGGNAWIRGDEMIADVLAVRALNERIRYGVLAVFTSPKPTGETTL